MKKYMAGLIHKALHQGAQSFEFTGL